VNRVYLSLLLAVALGAGLSEPPARVVRFMGSAAAETLAGAERVEVFKVSPKRARDEPDAGGYRVAATGKPQGKGFAARLAGVLLDEKSYRFDANRVGGFEPVVVLKAWKGETWVEVLFSFASDEVVVRAPAKDGAVRSAQEEIDPVRGELVRLVKEALPEDPDVQALREGRGENDQ
jgi:hypothetical protein